MWFVFIALGDNNAAAIVTTTTSVSVVTTLFFILVALCIIVVVVVLVVKSRRKKSSVNNALQNDLYINNYTGADMVTHNPAYAIASIENPEPLYETIY